VSGRLPFVYESTGAQTFFSDYRDPDPRARDVFAFHCASVPPECVKTPALTVPIRNKNTRIAYYHAIGQFLTCVSAPAFATSKISNRFMWQRTSKLMAVPQQPSSSIWQRSGCCFRG
jgi:hypothetical protein